MLGGGRGANRPAGSEAESEACALAEQWMVEAGLAVTRDAFGNVIGRLRGRTASCRRSGPARTSTASRTEASTTVCSASSRRSRQSPRRASARTLAVVAFRDEERGCCGSFALAQTGPLPGRLRRAARRAGAGARTRGRPLGVVTAIVGSTRREVVFEGAAGHAGTTPMDARYDALVQAAESCFACATRRRRSTARSRRSASSRSSRAP